MGDVGGHATQLLCTATAMQALGTFARKACNSKLGSVRQLLGQKHSNARRRRGHPEGSEQQRHASSVAASAERKRRWPQNLGITVAGGAGLSLAVASGGDAPLMQMCRASFQCILIAAISCQAALRSGTIPQATPRMPEQSWQRCRARRMPCYGWRTPLSSTPNASRRTPARRVTSTQRR